jgi:predicted RNase H-like nuclease
MGLALTALEDQLDALVCAYLGAYWWYWGAARNKVLGSAPDGYMVVPERVSLVLSPDQLISWIRV